MANKLGCRHAQVAGARSGLYLVVQQSRGHKAYLPCYTFMDWPCAGKCHPQRAATFPS